MTLASYQALQLVPVQLKMYNLKLGNMSNEKKVHKGKKQEVIEKPNF